MLNLSEGSAKGNNQGGPHCQVGSGESWEVSDADREIVLPPLQKTDDESTARQGKCPGVLVIQTPRTGPAWSTHSLTHSDSVDRSAEIDADTAAVADTDLARSGAGQNTDPRRRTTNAAVTNADG
jgi:hypothetical protein